MTPADKLKTLRIIRASLLRQLTHVHRMVKKWEAVARVDKACAVTSREKEGLDTGQG